VTATTESTVSEIPLSLTSPSTLLLIIANLVPIAGSIFLGWNLADVMVLYWAESAVIGFFNICKMAVIGGWTVLLAGHSLLVTSVVLWPSTFCLSIHYL